MALECHFKDNLYIEDEVACVEVSLNNGKTYSQGCTTTLRSERIPYIRQDSFSPLNSHVQDVVWLDFEGERFKTDREYVCVFKDEKTEVVAKTELKILSQTSDGNWSLRCQTPDPNSYLTDPQTSHKLAISVYHVHSGLRVHAFSTRFTYFAYLELLSVAP